MAGIVFFRTENLRPLRDFYVEKLGCEIWLHQGDCIILRHGNLLFGFCERDTIDSNGLVTFFYDSESAVDDAFARLRVRAEAPPKHNPNYNIYHFYATDPDNRPIECQYFENGVSSYRSGDSLLTSRRSVKQFTDQAVSREVIDYLVEVCRYAPSYANSQPYAFKIVRDVDTLSELADQAVHGSESLLSAPIAVVITADPEKSQMHLQDGGVAAYHFMLAAWFYGLGTCWLSGFDTSETKSTLGIPASHTIIAVTPLGYPVETITPPPRREPKDLLHD